MSGFLGDTMNSILGGGIKGGQPKGGLIGNDAGLSMRGGSVRGRDRAVLRRAFGSSNRDFGWPGTAVDISPLAFSNPTTSCPGWYLNGPGQGEACGDFGSSCGQFRAATSAGDIINGIVNLPVNAVWGKPSNQVNKVGRNITSNYNGIHTITSNCLFTFPGCGRNSSAAGAAYSGNPKYVYDSSDFIRFKKLKAKNANYNDSSFGGGTKQSPYTARARVRH